MTQHLTSYQRVGAFLLRANAPMYLQEIMRGTRLSKNQVAGALHYFVEQDIVDALGTASPGRARRFIVRERTALEMRVANPNRHGGGTPKAARLDFAPLIAAMGAI